MTAQQPPRWNEARIASAIARQVLLRKCIVLVDRCNWTGYEADLLCVTQDLRLIDVEIKISRSDFAQDAKKDKWWHRNINGAYVQTPAGRHWKWGEPVHRDWPPKIWKHYFAMPADIWDDALFEKAPSPASGVLLLSHGRTDSGVNVKVLRRATPNRDAGKVSAAAAIDIARLANLRMWNAYMQTLQAGRDHIESEQEQ